MKKDVYKSEFGRRFRAFREGKKLSRAALAFRLGISPKTIQSWEMGRTFIENLSLIPAIETELETTFAHLLGHVGEDSTLTAAEPLAAYGQKTKRPQPTSRVLTGPQRPTLNVYSPENTAPAHLEETHIAVPLIKPGSANKEVAELQQKDILRYCLFPANWCPRGRVLIALRMSDSSLTPAITLGATVLIDRRVVDPERLQGKFAAIWLHDRGTRIRWIRFDDRTNRLLGCPFGNNYRGQIEISQEKGDRILGKVLGFSSQID